MKQSATKAAKPAKPAQKGIKLQIDNEVTRCIRQHARAHMKTEVCGVLIGEERNGTVAVEASIEALSATQAGTHVTFTQDAWEEIYRVKDASYPDHRIVGWYHSHPGFGVFLSEHDTFIHRNFFSSPNQVAWVYDPHTDEEGCFGWFDGQIQRIAALSIVDLNGEGSERTPKERPHQELSEPDPADSTHRPPPRDSQAANRKPLPGWLHTVVTVSSYLTVAILGFFVAYFFFPVYIGIGADPRTGEVIVGLDGRPLVLGRIRVDQLPDQPQPQLPHSLQQSPAQLQPQPPAPQQPAPQQAQPQPPAAPAPTPQPASPAHPNPTPGSSPKPTPGGSK